MCNNWILWLKHKPIWSISVSYTHLDVYKRQGGDPSPKSIQSMSDVWERISPDLPYCNIASPTSHVDLWEVVPWSQQGRVAAPASLRLRGKWYWAWRQIQTSGLLIFTPVRFGILVCPFFNDNSVVRLRHSQVYKRYFCCVWVVFKVRKERI